MDNRPDGTVFWGEARDVTEDWSLLTGIADWVNGTNGDINTADDGALQRVRFWGEGLGGSFDDFAVFHPGFSGVWMCYGANDTYLDLTDDVADFDVYWMIRARGLGTITAYDDYDPDWTYSLPVNAITGGQTVTGYTYAGPWQEYHFPAATSYTIEQLMADDGGVCRLGLEISVADVAIDQIQMRVYPKTGIKGWWRDKAGSVIEDNALIWKVGVAPGTEDTNTIPLNFYEFDWDDDLGAGQIAAYDEWTSLVGINPESGNPLWEFKDSPNAGWGFATSEVASDVRGSLGASEHIGRFKATFTHMVVHTESNLNLVNPNPNIDEEDGVDFIRRPDRIAGDQKQFYSYGGAGITPSVSGWINANLHVSGFRFVYGTIIDYDTGLPGDWPDGSGSQVENKISINIQPYVAPPPTEGRTPPLVPIPYDMGGIEMVMNDISGGGDWTADDISVSLPSAPGFIVTLGNTFTNQQPPIHVIPHVISMFEGSTVTQNVSVFFGNWEDDSDTDAWLKAQITIPNYRVWDPDGTPGGKLNVRLPDNTWRVVGDESGSDTERLKLRTPDNTWWQEYRTSDGAVTTHPLKIYTMAGWVVAARMTPD